MIIGKIIETLGAICIAYVSGRIAYIELNSNDDNDTITAQNTEAALQKLTGILAHAREVRRKKFSRKEALIVLIGAILISAGCIIYTIGMIMGGASH